MAFQEAWTNRLTSSINNELPRAATDLDRGDVSHVFVCDRSRADIGAGPNGGKLDTVNGADALLASVHDILDRSDIEDVLQRQNGCLGLALNRRC